MMAEATIPLLPCTALGETLDFYRTLGFEVTHEQTEPYLYGAVRRGGVELHFARLNVYGAKNAFGASLVFVDELAVHHRAFADALRREHGKVPTAGLPRITRLRRDQSRFKIFDPSGNLLIYIDRQEAEGSYGSFGDAASSALVAALENAAFLRDTYANDAAAAKVLDTALQRHPSAAPIDRARALASRAELAVAMGDTEAARALRRELRGISLSTEDQERFRSELESADALERWLTRGE
jgi:hypothetical protein